MLNFESAIGKELTPLEKEKNKIELRMNELIKNKIQAFSSPSTATK
jgi:hypothetical protein